MSTTPLAELLDARLPLVRLAFRRSEGDVEVLGVEARQLVDVARFLSSDADAAYDLVDLTAIDRGPSTTPRFLVFVCVVSRTHQSRARLEIEVEDEGGFPSLSGVWPAALVYEREVIDLFGIVAEGHPWPQRLLLSESFVGHPLRVDHPVAKYQPQVPPPTDGPDPAGGAP